MTEDEVTSLIGQIYESAFDETLWVPIMNRMADAVGGGATALIRKNLVTGQGSGLYGRITEQQFTDYFGRFARANPLARAIAAIQPGSFLIDWQVIPKPDLIRSEYYNDFLLRREIHGVLGLMVWREGAEAAIINLTRQPGHGEYLPEHARRLSCFMPHLRHAVGLAGRLVGMSGRAALDAIQAWSGAALVLDGGGRLLYANYAAEQVLAARDGLGAIRGALTPADPVVAARLAAAIARASAEPPRGSEIAVPRIADPRPYLLRVTPCRPGHASLFPSPARVVVTVTEIGRRERLSPETLRVLFGLSRAQAAVAVQIAAGHEPREIAVALGVSLFTVRRHLADVMAKTETATRAQLARLLAQVPDRGEDTISPRRH